MILNIKVDKIRLTLEDVHYMHEKVHDAGI